MTPARLLLLFPLLTGCSGIPDVTTLLGTVFDTREVVDGLPDAEVIVRDRDGKRFSKGHTDETGGFKVDAPAGDNVFLEIAGPGTATVTFAGITGIEERYRIHDGLIFGYPEQELEDLEDRYAGCPGVGEGGVVVGELRVISIVDSKTGEHPLVTTGQATVVADDGRTWNGCYLDEAGLAYDAAAAKTGATGQFAVFGVEPGVHVLRMQFTFAEVKEIYDDYFVYIPAQGAVSPRFPTFVEVPLPGLDG